MNILVTSGGTSEKIDTVRSISNMSTGKLGALIAERFASENSVNKIFYVCSNSACKPQCAKAEIIYVDSVLSLESAIKTLLAENSIDIIIHGMAVSDYRVSKVTSSSLIADSIASHFAANHYSSQDAAREATLALLKNAESLPGTKDKISSTIDDMLLFMEKTPKIISLFKQLSPESTLVGFKLLNNVPLETLIEKGYQVLTENKCTFVLANDLKAISEEQHIGYLIDINRNYRKYLTKAGIAEAIASAALAERGKAST